MINTPIFTSLISSGLVSSLKLLARVVLADLRNCGKLIDLLPARASEQGNVIRSVRIYIREYGSTLYVGLARAVSPTNTNFRLTFLLT